MYQLSSKRCTPVHFEKKELKGNPRRESLSGTPTQFLGPRRNHRSGVRTALWVILIACLIQAATCSSQPKKVGKKGTLAQNLPRVAKARSNRKTAVQKNIINPKFSKVIVKNIKKIQTARNTARKTVEKITGHKTKTTQYVPREKRSPRTLNGGRDIRETEEPTVNAKKVWFTMTVTSQNKKKQAFVYLPPNSPGLLFTPRGKNKSLISGGCIQVPGSYSWDGKTYYKVLNFRADPDLLTLCDSEPCPSSVLDFIKKATKKGKKSKKRRRLMDRLVRETFRASEE